MSISGVVLALLNLTFHLKGGKSQKNHLLSSKGPVAPFHSIPAMKISVKPYLRSVKDPPAAQISAKWIKIVASLWWKMRILPHLSSYYSSFNFVRNVHRFSVAIHLILPALKMYTVASQEKIALQLPFFSAQNPGNLSFFQKIWPPF